MNGVIEQEQTYTRPSGEEVVGDSKYISSIRDEQSRDIIDNCRIGNYDSNGNYAIDPEITAELIGMNKWIYRETLKNVLKDNKKEIELIVNSRLPLFGDMEFRLVVAETSARLYLIEEVFREGGGYLETYGEKIAEYVSDSTEKEDLASIFTLFNIRIIEEDEEDDGKKVDEEDSNIEKLLVRKIYLSLLAKQLIDETAAEEKAIFDKIVAILKEQGGEYGKRVLKNFIDRLERRPEVMGIKDKSGYNKALNDMLMGAIEVVTTDDDMKDDKIKKIFIDINNLRNNHTQDNIDKVKRNISPDTVKKVYDKVRGDKAKLTLQDVSRIIDDTQDTLKKPEGVRKSKPILKQETRQALLKQTPKNVVVEETHEKPAAAALKKETAEPVKKAPAKKPVIKKEDKAPVKKPAKAPTKVEKGKAKSDSKPKKKVVKEPAKPIFVAVPPKQEKNQDGATKGTGKTFGASEAPYFTPSASAIYGPDAEQPAFTSGSIDLGKDPLGQSTLGGDKAWINSMLEKMKSEHIGDAINTIRDQLDGLGPMDLPGANDWRGHVESPDHEDIFRSSPGDTSNPGVQHDSPFGESKVETNAFDPSKKNTTQTFGSTSFEQDNPFEPR